MITHRCPGHRSRPLGQRHSLHCILHRCTELIDATLGRHLSEWRPPLRPAGKAAAADPSQRLRRAGSRNTKPAGIMSFFPENLPQQDWKSVLPDGTFLYVGILIAATILVKE